MQQTGMFEESWQQPLAARMRPTTLRGFVGQQHIIGEGKPLRKLLESGKAHSMILWGPPGTGKTTLANIIAHHAKAELVSLSAVSSGVKDIRQAVDQAKERWLQSQQRTLLFVDEVHRFNKSQQDAFLPHIEDGTFTFIGATTENPAFELNSAILSRARVYVLKLINEDDLGELLDRVMADKEKGVGDKALTISPQNRKLLIQTAAGDARKLLIFIELCADLLADGAEIDKESIALVTGSQLAQFDKGGDHFFDMISAFHKSVRGSAPDAALYWYCRILEGGGDPLYVARRLLAIATEDIGNADPRAMQIALNAWDIFHRLGPSEGERAIAQATIYLASAAKSNAVYTAFNSAKQAAKQFGSAEVPLHLRNAPTKLAESLGHGKGYRYAHDEPEAFAAGEEYLPEELAGTQFYQPSERGLEKQIKQKLAYLAEHNQQSNNKR